MKKRGLSPVIASVLLVGITIVLVAILWVFISRNLQTEMKGTESCFQLLSGKKVSLNNEYTCYNPEKKEVQFSIEIGDLDVEEAVVTIYGEAESRSFKIHIDGTTHPALKPYNEGNFGDSVSLPKRNAGKTYVVDLETAVLTKPHMIKISPIIDDETCEVTDTISSLDDCRLFETYSPSEDWCFGNPTPCEQINPGSACLAQSGCVDNTLSCSGTPTPCNDIEGEENCWNHGCQWGVPPEEGGDEPLLGEELIFNGGFDGGSQGWNLEIFRYFNGYVNVSLEYSPEMNPLEAIISQDVNLESGKKYLFSFRYKFNSTQTADSCVKQLLLGTDYIFLNLSKKNEFSYWEKEIQMNNDVNNIGIDFVAPSGKCWVAFDDISVKEIL